MRCILPLIFSMILVTPLVASSPSPNATNPEDSSTYSVTPYWAGAGTSLRAAAAGSTYSATWTDAAGEVDIIGFDTVDPALNIGVFEDNTVEPDGSCTIVISLRTQGAELFPTKILPNGSPATGGFVAYGDGTIYGGTSISFGANGPVGVLSATTETHTPGGINTQDVTFLGDFAGDWDGDANIPYGTPGAGITRVDLVVNYTDAACVQISLPVELTNFSASTSGQSAVLAWTTLSESGNAGFEVELEERSGARTLGFVAGHGTTIEEHNYSFVASDLRPGKQVFRLRKIDTDGTSTLSSAVEVIIEVPGTYMIGSPYPNPFNPTTTIEVGVSETQRVMGVIFNSLGQHVMTAFDVELGANEVHPMRVDLGGLPSASYILRVSGRSWTNSRLVTLTK